MFTKANAFRTAFICLMLAALIFVAGSLAACKKKDETAAYTITFIADGTEVDTIKTAGNETITLPSAPNKTDYEFIGWYLDNGTWQQPFTADYFAGKPLTDNISVYAKYEYNAPQPTKYDIAFYAFDELVSTVKTAGNETITLPSAPNKTDYEFIGWFLDDGTFQQPFTADYFAGKPLTGNISVYAKYEYNAPQPTKYDISFYAFDELVSTVKTAGNETITLPSAPSKTNYEFIGWYLDNGTWKQPFTGDYFAGKPLTDNISVYAKYEYNAPQPTKYDIAFYAFDELVSTVKTAGNETITLPSAPNRTNYEFIGWYLDNGTWKQPFTANYFASKPLTGNISVYAKYEYNAPVYTVEFETFGGTYVAPVTGETITEAPQSTKNGFELEGWYLDPDFTQKAQFPFAITHDCTLYANWVTKSVEFTLNSYNQISGVKNVPENGEIYIPAKVNGVTVTGIASYAFRDNTQLTKVEIDPAITYLGVGVFWRCYNLTSVTMSDKVTELPSNTFTDCRSLAQFTIPSSVTTIGADAFWGTPITSITIPDSVKSIWQYAFKDCTALTYIDLGKVEDLGQGIFQNCTSLTSITFPDTIKDLDGNYMFSGCKNLAEINYPDVAVPLNYNFAHETAYYNDAKNWQDGALYVGNHLVTVDKEFKNKTSFTVRAGTVTVARLAFYEASYGSAFEKLTSLTLPEGLKAIGERAFENCDKIGSVKIPSTVVRIYSGAFSDSILDSEGYLGVWLIKYNLSGTTVNIKEGTIGIADGYITTSQSTITSVTLPSTLKYIGKENFRNMSKVAEINLPEGLVSIGESAFAFCSSVKTLYISSSVTEIDEMAFNQIPGLKLFIARAQNDIPAGWANNWDFSYSSTPIEFIWDYKN